MFFKEREKLIAVAFFAQIILFGLMVEIATVFVKGYVIERDNLLAMLLFIGVYLLPVVALFLLAVYSSWRVSRRSW